jgi:hypothetical protein
MARIRHHLDRPFAAKGPVSSLNCCCHLRPSETIEFPPLPEDAWDRGFFRATGIAMMLGTAVAGAITMILAITIAP